MKRIFVITLFALCNIYISISQCIYPSQFTTVTVYTPNNLSVTAGKFTGTDINITSGDIAAWTLYLSQNYGAEYMGNPTYTYNCHGYAWHMTDGNNPTAIKSPVWINQPCLSPYMSNNGGYVSCSESEATKVFYHPDGDHSAIRLDSYWYQSKWGANYLVKHPPNSVDYIYQASKPKTYWKNANYTVSFNLNGATGTPPPTQNIQPGGTATKPSPDPNRTGFSFGGWYTNSAGTGSAFNFSTPINSNMTLYAKWLSPTLGGSPTVFLNSYVTIYLSNPPSNYSWDNNSYLTLSGVNNTNIPYSATFKGVSVGYGEVYLKDNNGTKLATHSVQVMTYDNPIVAPDNVCYSGSGASISLKNGKIASSWQVQPSHLFSITPTSNSTAIVTTSVNDGTVATIIVVVDSDNYGYTKQIKATCN